MPENSIKTPIIFNKNKHEDLSEREILYKVLFDMKRELNELKKITQNIIEGEKDIDIIDTKETNMINKNNIILAEEETVTVDESLSLFEQEKKLIEKCLTKHK